jgi:ADP-heptose:LPS heptosyltransferase
MSAPPLRRIELAARRLLLAALSHLRPPPRPWPLTVRRVVVLRLDDRVGDLLLTTPLLAALSRLDPPPEVHLVAAAARLPLVAGLPCIDAQHAWDRHWLLRRPWRVVSLVRDLRRLRPDVAVDASHWHAPSLTTAVLTWLCGARHTVGHPRTPRAHDTEPRLPAHTQNESVVKLTLAVPFGVDPATCDARLLTAAGTDPTSRATARSIAGDAPYAVLVPGARKPDHRAPIATFATIAAHLAGLGLTPVIVWGPGDVHVARALHIAIGAPARLAPATDLPELAALLRGARVAVTNDSGPQHLAAATGVPVMTLFVRGDLARWTPPGDAIVTVDLRDDPSDATLRAAADRAAGLTPPTRMPLP